MLEGLIILALAVWVFLALRSAGNHPACGGDCTHCAGGCKEKNTP